MRAQDCTKRNARTGLTSCVREQSVMSVRLPFPGIPHDIPHVGLHQTAAMWPALQPLGLLRAGKSSVTCTTRRTAHATPAEPRGGASTARARKGTTCSGGVELQRERLTIIHNNAHGSSLPSSYLHLNPEPGPGVWTVESAGQCRAEGESEDAALRRQGGGN